MHALSIEEILSKGCVRVNQGQDAEAKNFFDWAERMDPNCMLALAELRRIAVRRHDVKTARELSDRIDVLLRQECRIDFGPHDPWSVIGRMMIDDKFTNNQQMIEEYVSSMRGALSVLADKLGWTSQRKPINNSYSAEHFQEAYMIFLFPYHIEPIFQELALARVDKMIGIDDHITITMFGCGPAPELLGISRFVSERMPKVKRMNAYLFDNNDWRRMQGHCLQMATDGYVTRADLELKAYQKNLDVFLPLSRESQIDGLPGGVSHICIMQNCLRDLLGEVDSLERVNGVLRERFSQLAPGGVMVILDLKYPEVKTIISEFESILDKDDKALILRSRTVEGVFRSLNAPKPNIVQEMESLYDRREKDGKPYYSLVAMRL